ncbi:MAG: hypothetical protein H7233_12655 [Pseudorhodobacter sp.]|nr:hypothetical protein [Frankiaceae bacterium]
MDLLVLWALITPWLAVVGLLLAAGDVGRGLARLRSRVRLVVEEATR